MGFCTEMTTLLSWTGVDTHGSASIYIASDSRISWEEKRFWDVGRKVFASKTKPEIFGYCGSVAFPIQILGQLVELIDSGLLFSENETYDSKLEKVRLAIEESYGNLPTSQKGECHVLYATRVGTRMRSTFHAARIKINGKNVIKENIELPEKSGLIISAGSGKVALKSWYEEWVGLPNKDPHRSGRTSRNVFSAFCDSLESQADRLSGGAPQLVGIYRVGAANSYGIIHNNKRFLNGIEVKPTSSLNEIEWRNLLFERCCGETMKILKKAQRQPKLREIKQP